MGLGRTATVGFRNAAGGWEPVSSDNPLPIAGGGGGGAVESVNGKTGAVVLTFSDVGAVSRPTVNSLISQAINDLATVATSGSYDDLEDKPSIPSPVSDTGWIDLTLSAAEGITAVAGATPQYRIIGSVLYLHGSIEKDGGFESNMRYAALVTFPAGTVSTITVEQNRVIWGNKPNSHCRSYVKADTEDIVIVTPDVAPETIDISGLSGTLIN